MKAHTKLVIKKSLMDASIFIAIATLLGLSVLYLTQTIQISALLSITVTLFMCFLLFAIAEPLKKTNKADFDSLVQEQQIEITLAERFKQCKSQSAYYDLYEVFELLQADRINKTMAIY